MLEPLRNTTYRRLFAAQILSLLGTGLATVALGLLAYDLAGPRAGIVLGTALTIKMVAFVTVPLLGGALLARLPRRQLMVTLDLVRAAMALSLPFVDQIWQVYLLVFLLQSASAGFTPTFQAVIPDVLPDEAVYTRALSLSRLAYDLESLASPALAAALLLLVPFHALFGGTSLGFLASAALVLSCRLPARAAAATPFARRATAGLRIYLGTPRLRGLLALTVGIAASSAMVIVNTVVLVRDGLGLGDAQVAVALGAYGLGSMAAALSLPRLLDQLSDRPVMLSGGACLAALLALGAALAWRDLLDFPVLLSLWAALGAAFATVQTPAGRLIARSARSDTRPAVFAAQFALSHACWLVAYPAAGVVAAGWGTGAAFALLALAAGAGLIAAHRLWPAADAEVLAHRHDDLPAGHPHLAGAEGHVHRHAFRIDELHPRWPGLGG